MASKRFILTVIHDTDTVDLAESFSSLMTLRGHYVRIFNDTGSTTAMCHGCFELLVENKIIIPSDTIVVCFKELTFDEARSIDTESELLVQILSGRPSSPKSGHAIWSSRAGFFYSHGIKGSKFKLERHQIINLPYFEREQSIPDLSRELILVFGNKIDHRNEKEFNLDDLDKAKVVVVNTKRLFSVPENLISKILMKRVPIICWSGTQVEEFITDRITGFVINSQEEILRAIERVSELDIDSIEPKFSSGDLCEKFERFFSEESPKSVGLVDLFVIGETWNSELCQRVIGEKDVPNQSVVRLEDVWNPKHDPQLNEMWKIDMGSPRTMIPLKVESIKSVCHAQGITGIELMIISGESRVENLVKEFENLEIFPRQIIFDQIQSDTDCLDKWGYHQSKESECLFVSKRVRKIGFDPELTRFIHGIQDRLSKKDLRENFLFEEIDRDIIFEYSKLITMERYSDQVLERRRVDPRMIYAVDPQAFPRKFYPKRLRTVGIFGKPKMKIIGKLIDGKLVPNEPVEKLPGEVDQEQIVEVLKQSGLGLRYIYDIPINVTFEMFRDLDLIVFNETSSLCQEAFEAIFCGVPIVSIDTGLLKSFDHIKFSSREDLEKAIDVLSDEKVYIDYRDSLFKIVEESLNMDKLKLNFLK